MLAASASLLNIELVILDQGEHTPAKQVYSGRTAHIDGSFSDHEKIIELASKVDVLTVEIEHVNVDALDSVSSTVKVHPAPATLRMIQDKFLQKEHLQRHGIPVAPYEAVASTSFAISEAATRLQYPLMLKSRTLAYDGRGNAVVKSGQGIENAIALLGDRPLYAEGWAPFVKEVAVMVVRSISGEVRSYPAVETVHKDSICHLVFAPLRDPDPTVPKRAQEVAEKAIQAFNGAGVFGVELFLLADGESIQLQALSI